MPDLGNLLQGSGIFVCIGAILLIVVLAVAARSLFGSRSNRRTVQDNREMYPPRGTEQPRYDSDRIESSGGFGNPRGRSRRSSGLGRQSTRRPPSSGDRLTDYRQRRGQQNDADDDDNIRSRGGFGG